MPLINDSYINALLADATYVDNLSPGLSVDRLSNLLSPRMTAPQAQFIAANFEVRANATTGGSALTSGFDATVWQGKAGTDYANKTYVSLRGTAGAADLLSDIDLAFNGAARAQYVDMINWWLRSTTAATGQAKQIRLASGGAGLYFEAAPTVAGTGALIGVTHIEVNGHSLGGHLATAFARLFGASIKVDHVSTFNSAGFRASSDAVLRQIETLIGTGTGRYPDASQQTNFFAEHGINLTTNALFFGQIGQRVELFNEYSSVVGIGVPNHSMYKLTDSLALAAALAKLDPGLTLERINTLFEASASQTPASLEGILDALRRLLLGPSVAPTPVGDVADSDPSRVAYQTNLQYLQDSAAYKTLSGHATLRAGARATATLDRDMLASKAKTDFGDFLAVQYLLPVAIENASGTLAGSHGDLYAQWQADAALTAVERAAGKANFSDTYLADRAAFLTWKNKLATEDFDITRGAYTKAPDAWFADLGSGLRINLGADITLPADKTRYVFGGDQGSSTETLTGGSQSDRLYGGDDVHANGERSRRSRGRELTSVHVTGREAMVPRMAA